MHPDVISASHACHMARHEGKSSRQFQAGGSWSHQMSFWQGELSYNMWKIIGKEVCCLVHQSFFLTGQRDFEEAVKIKKVSPCIMWVIVDCKRTTDRLGVDIWFMVEALSVRVCCTDLPDWLLCGKCEERLEAVLYSELSPLEVILKPEPWSILRRHRDIMDRLR